MGVFEITGVAEREYTCDIAEMTITFMSTGRSTHEVSEKAMKECERFLGEVESIGIKIPEIRIVEDRVIEEHYEKMMKAERVIFLEFPFDMALINRIRKTLHGGKYEHEVEMSYSLSNKEEIHKELCKEAVEKSRMEVEIIASALGMKIKGVKSATKSYMEERRERGKFCVAEAARGIGSDYTRSDELEAEKTMERETVTMKWVLE